MKNIFTAIIFFTSISLYAQDANDVKAVERTCMNYIEGFYEGDTTKLVAALKPSMYKLGFWKNKDGSFSNEGLMSYQAAMNYANNVKEKKKFPKPTAPKEVKIFEVSEHIASAKVTAWWGFDYMLLSKENGKWMIEEILWQGPLFVN